jgi:hypothetical protein
MNKTLPRECAGLDLRNKTSGAQSENTLISAPTILTYYLSTFRLAGSRDEITLISGGAGQSFIY